MNVLGMRACKHVHDKLSYTFTKQEAFEKCWAHSPLRAAARHNFTLHSPGVATVARRLRIDVHDDNDNDVWQRDHYGPIEWAQLHDSVHEYGGSNISSNSLLKIIKQLHQPVKRDSFAT